jgi:hypothetical protein
MKKMIALFVLGACLNSSAQLSFASNGQLINKMRGNNVALGDFNNDGYLDAFVVNISSKDGAGHRVYLNDGKGQFKDNGQRLTNNNLDNNAAIGDINADGNLEVITGATIWLNDTKGLFEAAKQKIIFTDTNNVLGILVYLSDLNQDGSLDLLSVVMAATSSMRIYFNDGYGRFTDSGQRLGGGVIARVALGDIDRNKSIDVLTMGWRSNTLPFPNGTDYCPNKTWINDGKGHFKEGNQIFDEGYRHVHDVKLGDINNDGSLDLLLGMTSDPYVKSFINDGSGHFTMKQSVGNVWVNSLDLGDLNNDGALDVFFVSGDCFNQPAPIPGQVWLNDGAGLFIDSKLRSGKALSADIRLGDFNGDKKLDAFTVNWGWDSVANEQIGSPAEILLNTSQPFSNKTAGKDK